MKTVFACVALCGLLAGLAGCNHAPPRAEPGTAPATASRPSPEGQATPEAARRPEDPRLRGIRPAPAGVEPAAGPRDPQREEPGVGVGGLMREPGSPQ